MEQLTCEQFSILNMLRLKWRSKPYEARMGRFICMKNSLSVLQIACKFMTLSNSSVGFQK